MRDEAVVKQIKVRAKARPKEIRKGRKEDQTNARPKARREGYKGHIWPVFKLL